MGSIDTIPANDLIQAFSLSINDLLIPIAGKGPGIGTVVELLQGRLSISVMSVVTSRDCGLFLSPADIEMSCSCPDWAAMCKHVAATLYGVGNRLDREPQLLFKLRQVDHLELIAQAGQPAPQLKSKGSKTIAKDQSSKSPRSKKAVAIEKTKSVRADAGSGPEGAPAVSSKPAGSRRKTLTVAARKRIAEAQVKRWRDARDRMRSQDRNGNQYSPSTVKKSAKVKLAPSAHGKPARRSRAV